LTKPERIIGSPAVKELVAVKVTIPPVPDHAVIVETPPVGAGKEALPFGVKQPWFNVKSGE
jgi:hypothetical protein